jgi:hypothetical protein
MKTIKKYINKLTLFDKLIIVLLAVSVIFFAYYFFRKPDYKTVVIKVGEDTVGYLSWQQNIKEPIGNRVWLAQMFHNGMQEKDGLGKVTAEVLSVYSFDTAPARKVLYLTTKLNSTYNRATNQYTYKGKPLIIGSLLKINFDGVYVEGMITDVEGFPDVRKQKNLIIDAQLTDEENLKYLETSGVSPSLAASIFKAREIKDSTGRVVAKIMDIKTEDAKRLTVDSTGRSGVQTNPLRKDVYLKIEIKALEIDNKYYMYDDIPILIGQKIPLNTTYYSIFPEVTNITPTD